MSVDELPDHLRQYWPGIRAQLEAGRYRAQLEAGRYRPQPVKRVDIPKPDGKTRPLGIPTVLDRFVQQAITQIVSAQWEPTSIHTVTASGRNARPIRLCAKSSEHPRRLRLGSGHGPASLLRPGQS